MRRWIGYITRVLLLTAAGLLPGHGWAAEGPPTPRPSAIERPQGILFLNTFQIGHPIPDSIDRGFLAGLQAGGKSVSDVFIEHLDLARGPDAQYEKDLGRLLYQRVAAKHIGIVIAEGPPAVNFFRTQYGNLFPDAPLLTLIVPRVAAPSKSDPRKILDIPWRVDNSGTLKAALKLFPKTSHVFVITSAKDTILPFLENARDAFASFKQLKFEYSNTMTYEQILQRVSTLPQDSIVMYSPLFSDGTGRSFVPADVVKNICKVSNAPVFANLAPYLGRGIVGGKLLETKSLGSRVAGLALDYLNGRLKIDKPLTTFAPSSKLMFDWRQLKHWDARISALPPGSVVINRPATLWGQYKKAIGIAAGVLILLGGAIIHLWLLTRRLKSLTIALGKSKAYYHSIFASSLFGVTVADKDFVFTDANDAFCKMLGYSSGELVGKKTISDVSYPEDVKRSMVMLNKLIEREIDQYTIETRYVTKTGTVLPAVVFVRGHYGPDGHYEGTTTSYLDITERKRAEKALLESEAKYRTLVENALVGVYIIQDNLFRFVNKRFCEIFGYSYEEIVDKLAPIDFIYDQDKEKTAENLRKRLSGEVESVHYKTMVLRKDHEVRKVEILGCTTSYNGRTAIIGTLNDITDREKTAEALREREEFLSTVIENIPDTICIKDAEQLRFLRLNKAAENLLGYNREELSDKNDFDLFPRDKANLFTKNDREVLRNKQVLDIPEESIDTKTGRRILRTKKIPILDKNENPVYLLCISEDITERKQEQKDRERLQAQLTQAQKMEAIGTLSGGVAHDFNNILSAIFGYTELAGMDLNEPARLPSDLQAIKKAAKRARDLVKQILTFSRKSEQEKRPLQVSLVVKEALKLIRSTIPASIEIKQDIASTAMALADPTQIHQVVMNLCTNAYQAMRHAQEGTLSVSLHETALKEKKVVPGQEIAPGRYVRLEVADTGHGLDEATRLKIFDPYFTTKEIGEGTGLGLAVVHGIVQDHGGCVTVHSELGAGTTFHVYLPIAEGDREGSRQEYHQPAMQKGSERIIFVDDEEALVGVAKDIFAKYGYSLTTFADGVQALQEFEKTPEQYDMLITDMTMPHMTGVELIKRARSVRPHLPAIICSGYSERLNREKAKAMDIEYVQKPAGMSEIVRLVRVIFDRNNTP